MSMTEDSIGRFRGLFELIPDGSAIDAETWTRRHRIMLVIAALHVPLLAGLGLLEGPEPISGATLPEIAMTEILLWVGIIAVLTAIAALPMLPRRARAMTIALALTWASTVLVSFSGGFIEAHFHYFVAVVWLAMYEDWVPLAVGVAVVAATHQLFSVLEMGMMFNHAPAMENHGFWANVHAAFVLAGVFGILMLWSSIESSRADLERKLAEIESKSDEIDQLEEERARIESAQEEITARKAEISAVNEELERKATDFSSVMTQAADGDLTARMDADTDAEAMERIGTAFNEMMDDIESTMREIQSFAHEVSDASENTMDGVNTAEGLSEDVTASIAEIADGADEQREMLEQVSGEMNNLSATIEEVASSTETVADAAQQTATIADDGEETARDAIDSVEQSRTAIGSTAEKVQVLDERMAEIGEIVDLIGDIAEQTNLLALNANIEAARAGGGSGASAGFAVVADEVKQLAEETQEAAQDIEAMIDGTQAQTAAAVEEVRTAEEHMEAGTEAVRDAADAFTRVADNAAETDDGIREISKATDDQAASTEETVSMAEEVAGISHATAEEADGVSAAADDQLTAMSQATTEAGSLVDQAERLRTLLRKFDVSDETTGGSGGSGVGTVAVGDGGRPD